MLSSYTNMKFQISIEQLEFLNVNEMANIWYSKFALTSALSWCARPLGAKVFQPRSGRVQRDMAQNLKINFYHLKIHRQFSLYFSYKVRLTFYSWKNFSSLWLFLWPVEFSRFVQNMRFLAPPSLLHDRKFSSPYWPHHDKPPDGCTRGDKWPKCNAG
jgi:hypothetical protein